MKRVFFFQLSPSSLWKCVVHCDPGSRQTKKKGTGKKRKKARETHLPSLTSSSDPLGMDGGDLCVSIVIQHALRCAMHTSTDIRQPRPSFSQKGASFCCHIVNHMHTHSFYSSAFIGCLECQPNPVSLASQPLAQNLAQGFSPQSLLAKGNVQSRGSLVQA